MPTGRQLAHLPKGKVESLVPRNVLAVTRLFPVLKRIQALTCNASGNNELRPLHDPEQPNVMLRLAHVLSSADLGREAAELYLQLATRLGSQVQLRLQRRATEALFRSGHFAQGVATLKPLLATIGMRLPAGAITAKLYAASLKLRGVEAAVCSRNDEAIQWFHQAQTACGDCHMPRHAHVVQWCRGRLMQELGEGLVELAEAWMTEQGIVKPGRYATMHAPCSDLD